MDIRHEIERIANEYRAEGYEVVVNPRGDQLPPFAAGLDLDLIAARGPERVVVAVRPRRSDLADEPAVERLAELVNGQPGWRFDLVLLEPESPLQRLAGGAEELSGEQFRALLDEARAAESAELQGMALVSAWAGFEAAMRWVSGDAELYGRTTPVELLSGLYANGFISRPEFDRAREAWAIRTRAVHGFVTPRVDPALIDDVIALAQKVMGLEELHAAPAAG